MSVTTPGVYILDDDRAPRAIVGVQTGIAAFLGETERGPLWPQLVTSDVDYQRWFGGVFREGRFMPHAVHGFFENGGDRLYISRVVGADATTASKAVGDFTVRAVGPGAWGRRVWFKVQDGTRRDAEGRTGFRLKVAYWADGPEIRPFDPFDPSQARTLPRPQHIEDHDNLSGDPASPDYFETRLGDRAGALATSALVVIDRTNVGSLGKPPESPPEGAFLDADGTDAAAALGRADFTGEAVDGSPAPGRAPQGLVALDSRSCADVALVYAPHPPDNAVPIAQALVNHSERLRYRFAVIDAPNADPVNLEPRTTIGDTGHAAVYAPWIVTIDPQSGARRTVPPGGHVLGLYARTDRERGVFKAPTSEVVRGAVDVAREIDAHAQDIMNPRGVNAIRRFVGRGILVWGARTLSSDAVWRYVPVRRLFIFLEHSIDAGTMWTVFEPNDERLWARVREMIQTFLRTEWRAGALAGATENAAFFVKVDRTTMTSDDILNGRLIVQIGVAPVRPAEFVIFTIVGHAAGG